MPSPTLRHPSAEADQRRRLDRVFALYRIILGREPDQDGLLAFMGQLREGATLEQLAAEFMTSRECQERRSPTDLESAASLLQMYAGAYGADAARAAELTCGAALEHAANAPARMARLIELAAPPAGPTGPWLRTGVKAQDAASYDVWRLRREGPSEPGQVNVADGASDSGLAGGPLLSWIMFISAGEPAELDDAIASVRGQRYEKVELLVVGRPPRALGKVIARHARQDRRIRWVRPTPWASSPARLSKAITRARGGYVGFIGAGDRLALGAGSALAAALSRMPNPGLAYVDEDQIEDGERREPWFKTDWDPEALMAMDTIGRGALIRKDLLLEAARGIDRIGPAWRHELMLRLSEGLGADQIGHVPQVIYHRRVKANPKAAGPRPSERGRKPVARRKAADLLGLASEAFGDPAEVARDRARAVKAHLARQGFRDCQVEPSSRDTVRVTWPVPEPAPLVSIIIPTRDKAGLLATCMAGIRERTDYTAFEVLIIDNGSAEAATLDLFDQLTSDHRVRVLSYPSAFNWGAINNFAVESAKGEIIVLLNNDTDVLEPGWLRELVAQVMRPEIGVVGATLFYGDLTVQHAGIVFGSGVHSAHVGRHLPMDDPGYAKRLSVVRSATAVTGACMALRRSVYLALGGVEADNLQVTWSDTDLCLKAWDQGLRVIMTPFARLLHLELATRGADETPEALERVRRECEWMAQRWGARLDHDPFHSDNLSIFGSYAE